MTSGEPVVVAAAARSARARPAGAISAGTGDGPPEVGLVGERLTVGFGSHRAVDDVSLQVAPGQVLAVVGPSGCGKSTLLRLLAGLEVPESGRVRWAGQDLTDRPPHERGFGLMFQDHALFPHRSVGENVAFGLRMAGVDRRDRSARVAEVLELVGLPSFEERTVDTLSGGEAQRVALARSLAPSPRALMLDEPLGSLDRTLRDRLAGDLRTLVTALGIAAIHVTHDQEEAYAVADRLVVMREGRVARAGPAADVWARPGSAFVARFLGHDNVLDDGPAAALGLFAPSDAPHAGGGVVVREAAIRFTSEPVATPPGGGRASPATVVDVRFRGATSRVVLAVGAAGAPTAVLRFHTSEPPAVGTRGAVVIDPAHVVPLAPAGGTGTARA